MGYTNYGSPQYYGIIIAGVLVGLAIVILPLYLIWQLEIPVLAKVALQLFWLILIFIAKRGL